MDQLKWLDPKQFRRVEQAREDMALIWHCGATPDLLDTLRGQLVELLVQIDDCDSAISNLSRFVSASRNPASLLALFERTEQSSPMILIHNRQEKLARLRAVPDAEYIQVLNQDQLQDLRRYLESHDGLE